MSFWAELECVRFCFEGEFSEVLPTSRRTPSLKLSSQMEGIVCCLEGDHVGQLLIVDRLSAGNLEEKEKMDVDVNY